MAAMRLGCLFSHEANIAYLHKAQSPYSVNSLAVLAAQAAVDDTAYVENYVAEVLAARELLCVGLEKLGIAYVPSSANFVLGHFGKRAIEVRDALREQRHPGARPQLRSPRLRAHHRGHARADARACWRRSKRSGNHEPDRCWSSTWTACWWTSPNPTARPSRAPSSISPACAITRDQIQDYKNQGGWNDDWELSHHIITEAGVDVEFEDVKAHFQELFLGQRHRRADPARTLDCARPACSSA